MKHSLSHKILTPLLALLLLFAATPKDFIHDLTGHEDTVHAQHDDDGSLGIGNKHHHCSFLTLLAPPFESTPFVIRFILRDAITHQPVAAPAARGTSREASCPASRGPPAA